VKGNRTLNVKYVQLGQNNSKKGVQRVIGILQEEENINGGEMGNIGP
jgi:hypothetical protein